MQAATPLPRTGPKLPSLLGHDPVVRDQVQRQLFSFATYLIYGLITAAQVSLELMDATAGTLLVACGLLANGVMYLIVRSGRVRKGRDPGLARTQLIVGVLFMYGGYAALGPAASGLLVVMASHIVYSMFMMTPRQVWLLAGSSLATLAATMALCGWLWPQRFDTAVQLSGLMYATLVLPLIALLAHRITEMTQQLRRQHSELQSALDRLHELATRDELTRAHNRRHMAELLELQQAQHRRLGLPLSLVLIDIDLFKSINDRYGHAAGDAVLRGFAELARQDLRACDLLGRWGGEEFLIALPHTSRSDALVPMERLLAKLMQTTMPDWPEGLTISFSAGITELGVDDSIDLAIDRADRAMYRAKSGGRRRCELG